MTASSSLDFLNTVVTDETFSGIFLQSHQKQ